MNNHPEYTPRRTAATLQAGEVVRYHAVPTVAQQNVAHHSWGVAVICLYITGGEASKELLAAAIMHDAAEVVTGDIPFTVKQANKEFKTLLESMEFHAYNQVVLPHPVIGVKEAGILKLADTIEGLLWCRKTERVTENVRSRWEKALEIAMEKFNLTQEERNRVNALAHIHTHLLFQA